MVRYLSASDIPAEGRNVLSPWSIFDNQPEEVFISYLFIYYTLLIPCRKFGPPYLGKATAAIPRAALNPVLQVHAGYFRVSLIHRTLTCVSVPHPCVYTQA